MTTLIIGCGYLGERLGTRLREQGERVFGTVRSPARADRIAALGIEPVVADLLGARFARCVCRRPGTFSTRSALTGPPGFRCAAFMSTASATFWRTCRRTVTRSVYASSTGVYGQTDGEWVDESSPADPHHESGRVCLEAEQLVANWARTNDQSATAIILRFAGLYGPGRMVRRSTPRARRGGAG